jgi:hypothetical protein
MLLSIFIIIEIQKNKLMEIFECHIDFLYS